MNVIVRYMRLEGLTQREAAAKFAVTQSRMSSLVRGKINLFSTSMLLAMLEKAGLKIYENIQIKAKDLFDYHGNGILLQGEHNSNSSINLNSLNHL